MSDRISNAVAFGKRMREQTCTTPGHEDRHAGWLAPSPSGAQRWVCEECHQDPGLIVHTAHYGRTQLGRATIRGAGMRYGTTVHCSCRQWRRQVNQAPSAGGSQRAKALFEKHLVDTAQLPE